jgi:hypothetical protein
MRAHIAGNPGQLRRMHLKEVLGRACLLHRCRTIGLAGCGEFTYNGDAAGARSAAAVECVGDA